MPTGGQSSSVTDLGEQFSKPVEVDPIVDVSDKVDTRVGALRCDG